MSNPDEQPYWQQSRIDFFEDAVDAAEEILEEPPAFTAYKPKGESADKTIWVPNSAMVKVHARLKYELEAERPLFLGPSYGGIKGGSPAKNIAPHTSNRYFFQLDLANAYSQVDSARLAKIIVNGRGTHKDIALIQDILETYCFAPVGDGLARGGPLSPYLFNVFCEELDWELLGYADSVGITYTRYLDDLTFSKPDTGFRVRDAVNAKQRNDIRAILTNHGMVMNAKKTRVSDVHDGPVTITGLQLDKNGQWHIKATAADRARKRLSDQSALYRGTLLEKEVRDLAAGYKGMLDAADHGRKRSKSERRLGELANRLLLEIPSL